MDSIFYNGNIVTLDGAIKHASAVAVKGGIIERIGDDEEIKKLAGSNTQLIDLGERLVLPGFIDSHMHILNYARCLKTVNLCEAKSIDDMIYEGKKFLTENPDTVWLSGNGYNEDHFEKYEMPDRHDLDKVSTEIPVVYSRICEHICVCNSRALDYCGINKDTLSPEGGEIDKGADGVPTGILRENAIGLATDKKPRIGKEEVKKLLLEGLNDAAKCGLTSVQSDDLISAPTWSVYDIIDAYSELDAQNALPVRVYEQCLLGDEGELDDFLERGYVTGYGSLNFRIGPLKLIGDGSLGARTAYMSRPYADAPETCGIPCFSAESLYAMVQKAHTSGMDCSVHCIGDAAMQMVIDAYEKVQKEYPRANMRHGIVHCQITDANTLERFKKLNVLAFVQPIFIDYDMHIAEKRVGHDLAMTSYAWRTLIESGVHTSGGSDCPVEPFDVLKGIYSAVTRRDMNGYPDEGWNSKECISVEQAVRMYTIDGAYASREENVKGSISVGKFADITVLEKDIFSIAPEQIKDAGIYMTVKGGEITYKAE